MKMAIATMLSLLIAAPATPVAAKVMFPWRQMYQTYCLDEHDSHGTEWWDVGCSEGSKWMRIDARGCRGRDFVCLFTEGRIIPRVDYLNNPQTTPGAMSGYRYLTALMTAFNGAPYITIRSDCTCLDTLTLPFGAQFACFQ